MTEKDSIHNLLVKRYINFHWCEEFHRLIRGWALTVFKGATRKYKYM